MSDKNLSVNAEEETTTLKKESNGTISFANEVVSTIVGLAAVEIDGVASMSGGIVDGITEFIGKKNLSKGIKVEVGAEEVAIDMAIIVKYGFRIPEVCQNVQQAVIKAVETMTGLKVVEVNIAIQGVMIEQKEKEPVNAVEEIKEEKTEKQKRVK